MAAIGDKYVLTHTALEDSDTAGTNPLVNVYAYEATSGSPSAQDLAEAFVLSVEPDILAVTNIHTVYKSILVVNLDDVGDFWVDVLNDSGDLSSAEKLPIFLAWEFEYVRAVRGVHNGRKAYAGLDESTVSAGAPAAGIVTGLGALAATLGSLIAGTLGSYTPRIWRRAGNYAPYSGTPPVGTPYPDTFYPIAGVQFNRISTQNSRKR